MPSQTNLRVFFFLDVQTDDRRRVAREDVHDDAVEQVGAVNVGDSLAGVAKIQRLSRLRFEMRFDQPVFGATVSGDANVLDGDFIDNDAQMIAFGIVAYFADMGQIISAGVVHRDRAVAENGGVFRGKIRPVVF